MARERTNRTPEQVTGDLLSKRLSSEQQLALLRSREFRQYHGQLREELSSRTRLHPDDFRIVHSATECDVVERQTGKRIRTIAHDPDFGSIGGFEDERRFECEFHNVSSVPFIISSGKIYIY